MIGWMLNSLLLPLTILSYLSDICLLTSQHVMMSRKRMICAFVVMAVIIQMGYYFEFLGFQGEEVELFDFNSSPGTSSTSLFLSPLNMLCNKTHPRPNVYIHCPGISMPAFSAINQLQVFSCLLCIFSFPLIYLL